MLLVVAPTLLTCVCVLTSWCAVAGVTIVLAATGLCGNQLAVVMACSRRSPEGRARSGAFSEGTISAEDRPCHAWQGCATIGNR